jgi:hypothetical protein
LREDDPRPLLVLREFGSFDDPDNETLSRKLYSETAVTLSHWFRCVRLPHHVEEADHPFYNLFAAKRPPQLFLASPDGAEIWPFDHQDSAARLEKLMAQVLDASYEEPPSRRCDDLVDLLTKFDRLDAEVLRLKEELDLAIEDDGPRGVAARKLTKKLGRAEAEMAELLATKRELQVIPLKSS